MHYCDRGPPSVPYAGVQHHDATLVNVYMYLYYYDLCNSTVGIMHVHMHNTCTLSHNAVFFMRVSADELYIPAAPLPHALHLGCRVHTVGLLLSGHPAGHSPSHCIQTHHLSVLFYKIIHTL